MLESALFHKQKERKKELKVVNELYVFKRRGVKEDSKVCGLRKRKHKFASLWQETI